MIILHKIIIKIHREIYKHNIRKFNHNLDFTLIAQNCIGGVIYNDLGIAFKSPTINMFIEGENFVKLVENFRYYMSIPPKPLCEEFIDPINNAIRYPKIAIDDLEICCLHYESCKDAIASWNKRRNRVNFENVYVIANTWNLHGREDLVKRLQLNSPYKTIIFSTKECNYEGTIQLPGDFWELDERGIVRPNLTDNVPGGYNKYFENFFDFVTWLND